MWGSCLRLLFWFLHEANIHWLKSARIRSFSGPYFPVFRLNAEIYSINLRIQLKYGKIRTGKTPNTDTYWLLFLVLQLENVDASITVPIPLGDFQLSGAGTWSYGDTRLKVKFLKDMNGYYSIKGYAETGKDVFYSQNENKAWRGVFRTCQTFMMELYCEDS